MVPILSSIPPCPNLRASNNFKGFDDDEKANANLKQRPSIVEILQA
jgi:hypothetical protein